MKNTNSINFGNTQVGNKVQITVRFDKDTWQKILMLQESHGFSIAEAIRRLVKRGIVDLGMPRKAELQRGGQQ